MKISIYVISTILFLTLIQGFNTSQQDIVAISGDELEYVNSMYALYKGMAIDVIVEDDRNTQYLNDYWLFWNCDEIMFYEEVDPTDCCMTISPQCENAFVNNDILSFRKKRVLLKRLQSQVQKEKPKVEKKGLKSALTA